jgi:GPH family glycoside/pentoside/hexuronide:cation symporter
MRVNNSTKIGYGAGDCGLSLVIYGLQLYLLYYYTDVLGISAEQGALIFFIAIVVDCISDPIAGYLIEAKKSAPDKNTDGVSSTKTYSLRHYLLIGSLPLCVSSVFMYLPNLFATPFLIALLTHLLFRVCFTFVSIPFYSMVANISKENTVRTSLVGYSMAGSALGALIVAGLTLQLVDYLSEMDISHGFLFVNLLFSLAGSCLLLTTYWLTNGTESQHNTANQGLNFIDMINAIWINKQLLILLSAMLFAYTALGAYTQFVIYYFKYVLLAESMISLALMGYLMASFLSMPLWVLLAKKFDKKPIWFVGAIIIGLCLLLSYQIAEYKIVTQLIIVWCIGAGTGAIYLAFWSMLPDNVELSQALSGFRYEAFTYSIASLFVKIANSFAIGCVAIILSLIEFAPNVTQSSMVKTSLQHVNVLIPTVLLLCSLAIISYYSLSSAKHKALVNSNVV